MRLCAVLTRAAGDVARKLVVETPKDVAVVVAAPLEAEERSVLGGRDEVERAVEARIVGLGDVDLGEQRKKAVRVRRVTALPTVEVEALDDLVALALAIQLVDLVAVARPHEHVRERRAQVAQRDVQPPAQVRDRVEALEPLDDVLACGLVLDGLCVVKRVAALLQIAAVARLPELLVGHAIHEPLQDGVVEALRIDDDAAQVQVHDGHAVGGVTGAKASFTSEASAGKSARFASRKSTRRPSLMAMSRVSFEVAQPVETLPLKGARKARRTSSFFWSPSS